MRAFAATAFALLKFSRRRKVNDPPFADAFPPTTGAVKKQHPLRTSRRRFENGRRHLRRKSPDRGRRFRILRARHRRSRKHSADRSRSCRAQSARHRRDCRPSSRFRIGWQRADGHVVKLWPSFGARAFADKESRRRATSLHAIFRVQFF